MSLVTNYLFFISGLPAKHISTAQRNLNKELNDANRSTSTSDLQLTNSPSITKPVYTRNELDLFEGSNNNNSTPSYEATSSSASSSSNSSPLFPNDVLTQIKQERMDSIIVKTEKTGSEKKPITLTESALNGKLYSPVSLLQHSETKIILSPKVSQLGTRNAMIGDITNFSPLNNMPYSVNGNKLFGPISLISINILTIFWGDCHHFHRG